MSPHVQKCNAEEGPWVAGRGVGRDVVMAAALVDGPLVQLQKKRSSSSCSSSSSTSHLTSLWYGQAMGAVAVFLVAAAAAVAGSSR